MSKQEEQKQEEIKTPKKKGRVLQVIERKLPLTEEEQNALKNSLFGRLLRKFW